MLAKATLVALFILLVWGNIVAGLKAGLACPDWPLCHGRVIPPVRWDIYVEFIHRVIGGITSVFIIILCYRRFRSYGGYFKTVPVVCTLLLLIQIVLGGIVVLLKLPVDLTTLHFGNAIVIFSLVLYMYHYESEKRGPKISFSGDAALFFLISVLIFTQAVLGAYVRHSESGLACPDFPKCLGFWIPPGIAGSVLAHYLHRLVAYSIFVVFLVIFLIRSFGGRFEEVERYIKLTLLFILVQIAFGAYVVLSKLTFYVTAIHLSIGLLILSLSLYMWFTYIDKNTLEGS